MLPLHPPLLARARVGRLTPPRRSLFPCAILVFGALRHVPASTCRVLQARVERAPRKHRSKATHDAARRPGQVVTGGAEQRVVPARQLHRALRPTLTPARLVVGAAAGWSTAAMLPWRKGPRNSGASGPRRLPRAPTPARRKAPGPGP